MNKAIFITILSCLLAWQASAQTFATGLNFDDAAYALTPLKKAEIQRSYENLPAKVDLKPYCPTPQKQGDYKTCVGWAVGYAACSITEGVAKNIQEKSVLNDLASSPDFVYAIGKSVQDMQCKRGASIDATLVKLKGRTIPRKKDFRAFCATSNALPTVTREGANISDFTRLFKDSDPFSVRLALIKKALANKKPVIVGIDCPKSFMIAQDIWSGDQSEYIGGHALCIVGYDDSVQGGVVDMMNSWGEEWGEKGFTKVQYRHLETILKYAYEIKMDIGSSSNNPSMPVANDAKMSPKMTSTISLKLVDGTEMAVQKLRNEDLRGLRPVKETAQTAVETDKISIKSQYKTLKGYKSGTQYRIYITVSEPVYLYVLGSDLTHNISALFPADATMSPYISNKNATIALPDEKWTIEMDNTKGKDIMLVLYSKEPLDITKMIQAWNTQPEAAYEKIYRTYAAKMLPDTGFNLDTQNMGFQAPLSIDAIILLSLEIEHQ